MKKEKAEKKEEDKKKRGDHQSEESEEDVGEFLDGPVVIQPLSEGDMGKNLEAIDDGKEVSVCTRNILLSLTVPQLDRTSM